MTSRSDELGNARECISHRHPGAAKDQNFHGKPLSNSISYALELDASMMIYVEMGLSKSPTCGYGADQQTANHIITECPLYRPPNDLHGLIDVDADVATRKWLLSTFPGIKLFLLAIKSHTQEEDLSHCAQINLYSQ